MIPRKILMVTNRVPWPLKDGGNIAMQAMLRGYHNSGWQVHLLAMNTSKHRVKAEVLESEFSYLHGKTWVNVNNDVTIKGMLYNYFFSSEPEHVRRFSSDEFRAQLKAVLKEFQPDVVQIESVYLSGYLPVVHKYSAAVTVLRMHNVEYQIWQGLAKRSKNIIKAAYLEKLTERVRNYERKAWGDYDLLLAITEKDAGLVGRLESVADIEVAPFSIEAASIRPATQKQEWVGYHIGAMDWLPNKEGIRWFLSKAWPLIQKRAPGFQFYFAGRNMGAEFKEKKWNGVHCMGEVDDADAFIANKKILIVPLWSGGGIRVKILEAMAMGKVVIATSKAIKGIEVKPDEHYLRAASPEDFAKAVKWCLANKDKAEEIADNGRRLVLEKYEQGRVMKQVTDKLEALIKRR